ncbi:nucleotidyltransferase [Pelotalea chapellei]|uniref:Nucleotidyltransferase n=1 Tax=Pelotalea chapellei TaxID=44671 RepID=A0ABS5U5J7_9BACT|nr:nucleotidyltransferase [Pelotalea chapellei]MBT1070929.1 nucleotidyltransferase [Pelotalea chapellei]
MQRPESSPEKGAEILTSLVPPELWSQYASVFAEGAKRGIRFVVGGGLAVSVYSGHTRRYTKDMDLFVREEDSGALLEMLHGLGFKEYTEFPYDRTWSYRAIRHGAIVDILWMTLNGKTAVDETWLTKGWQFSVRESRIRLIPVEELIVAKLYILKRDRTDWPDVMNLLYAMGSELDWARMFEVLGDDLLLLGGVMNVFRWLCPGKAYLLPAHIWTSLGLLPPVNSDLQVDRGRVALLMAEQLFPGEKS